MSKLLEKYLHEIQQSKIEEYRTVGAAIVMKEDEDGVKKVLLIQRSSDDHFPLHWDIPRGGCDYGKHDSGSKEPIMPCVIRECKEECGLDVIPYKYIDKFSYFNVEKNIMTVEYNYLCKMKDPNQEIKLSEEHQDYMWVRTLGEVELLMLPELKKTLSKVLDDPLVVSYDSEKTEVIEEK